MDVLVRARKIAADRYDRVRPAQTTMGSLSYEGFLAGWDAALYQVGLLV